MAVMERFSSRKRVRPDSRTSKRACRRLLCTAAFLTITANGWMTKSFQQGSRGLGAARREYIWLRTWTIHEADLQPNEFCSNATTVAETQTLLPKSQNCATKSTVVKTTIRSVNWCGSKGMLPWQKYHAPALDPAMHSKQTETPVAANNTTMSSSSLFLHQRYHSLSLRQKNSLRKKMDAEARACQPLNPNQHLHVVYRDSHIVVLNKPGGILCVPGPRRNPSLANLAHEEFVNDLHVDRMVVHRLDMDTWGIVVFALDHASLKALHDSFRQRQVKKTYQALLCGHVPLSEGEMELPLERDPAHPPFMRVALAERTNNDDNSIMMAHEGFQKMIHKAAKPSFTSFRVLSWEYLYKCPVTRVELKPLTGRTHQLRVHCAAMGHPIVGDDIYGYDGEGAPNAGLPNYLMNALYPSRAGLDVQHRIHSKASILCLHAQELCIQHPMTGAPMVFKADAPF